VLLSPHKDNHWITMIITAPSLFKNQEESGSRASYYCLSLGPFKVNQTGLLKSNER
jgi:hypothetical protein